MKILVAVPVFNEEKYVGRVLREIRKYARATAIAEGVEIRVLVVNDGSTDGTAGVPAEMHIFAAGAHGFGLGPGDPVLSTWPEMAGKWLERLK